MLVVLGFIYLFIYIYIYMFELTNRSDTSYKVLFFFMKIDRVGK